MALTRCSFCGKSQNDVPRLVTTEAGTAAICTGCTLAVLDVFASDGEASEPVFTLTLPGREVAGRIEREGRR